MSYVQMDQEESTDPAQADRREWWLTNGLGGYAGGTLSGVLTRRYHGLLIASVHPPLGRFLLLAKADAVLIDGNRQIPLHTNQWLSGARDPRGQRHIGSFRLDRQMPVWEYRVGDLILEQRIWMDQGRDQTRVGFRWKAGVRKQAPTLRIGLLANYRDHHADTRPGSFEIRTEPIADGLRLTLPDEQRVEVKGQGGRFTSDQTWIENFFLARERERGLNEVDHHLRVGQVEIPLQRNTWVGITASLGSVDATDLSTSLKTEWSRQAALLNDALPGVDDTATPEWVQQLVVAADSYLFQRRSPDGSGSYSVIAGYPWFGDWGRDTMIALPGLTLAAGRPQLAREILQTFGGYISQGMLPNVFPGSGETPEYNTVDAALWYIEAWRAYQAASEDLDALADVFDNLVEIVFAYRDGTRYGIRMDPSDGLIRAGVPGQQLTWMDARVDGREITPRHGKPVEINALWYNALRSMAGFSQAIGRASGVFDRLAQKAGEGFTRYRRGNGAGLYDVLDGPQGHEAAIRPNQILAVSLTHSPLTTVGLQCAVVEECRTQLLTPYGLRSLSPQDSRYQGRYLGGVAARDGAYHQGPVWGWLLGHYALAEYRVSGDAQGARRRLAGMANHLKEAGLGQISEIFDGDAPHTPRGAPAQAWSVACTLDAWWQLTQESKNEGSV